MIIMWSKQTKKQICIIQSLTCYACNHPLEKITGSQSKTIEHCILNMREMKVAKFVRILFKHNSSMKIHYFFFYLFGVLLIRTIPANRFNFCPILQCIPKDLFQAHRWIRTIDGEFICFGKLCTQLLCTICYTMRWSNGTSIAFYCVCNIWNKTRRNKKNSLLVNLFTSFWAAN